MRQPRPQGLLLVQNDGRRNPWPRLLKYSTNRGVFCHVTHDEMAFSVVVSSVWWSCLFSAIGNRYSNKTKTFHRVWTKKFWRTLGATLAALAIGFSHRHFERGEGPGDEVEWCKGRSKRLNHWSTFHTHTMSLIKYTYPARASKCFEKIRYQSA